MALEVRPPRARPPPVQGSRSVGPSVHALQGPPLPPVFPAPQSSVITQNPTVWVPPGHSQASLSSPDLLPELRLHQPKQLLTCRSQSCQPAHAIPLPSTEPASPNRKASACDTAAPPVTPDRDPAVSPDSPFRTPTADLRRYCHCPHAAPLWPSGYGGARHLASNLASSLQPAQHHLLAAV